MIYFDNAATTFPKPESVYIEMDKVNRTGAVNAGRGSYKAARAAAAIIEDTKQRMSELLHCKGRAEIVFTPSVTHAINQILNGLDIRETTTIYLSAYEHNAVARTVNSIKEKTGCSVEMLPLKEDTLEIDIDKTEYLFHKKKPDIVIMNVISNVTGYRLPIEAVFELSKKFEAVTVADAAQAVGLIDIDARKFFADFICFAGHKTLYGPFGIGGFVISNNIALRQVLTGGTGSNSLALAMPIQAPERYEAASPNIVAIAGLNASLKVLNQKLHETQISELTKYLIDRLKNIPSVMIMGISNPNICYGIVSFVVEGYDSNDVGNILDEEYDIAVRTGYHCAPFIHDYIKSKAYGGTVRVGLGMFNTTEEIDILVEAIETL